MKVRYFIEWAPLGGPGDGYRPAGVWVQGEGEGLDIEQAFLPGFEVAQLRAEEVVNRLIEVGQRALPADFLDYHLSTLPAHLGDRGPLLEAEFASAQAAVEALLEHVRLQWDDAGRRWRAPLPGER